MGNALFAAVLAAVAQAQPLQLAAQAQPVQAPRLQAFAEYRAALVQLRNPANFVFDYVVTRVGPKRVVTEKHRVYRNDNGDERNETNAVNGAAIVPAFVRVFHRPIWPYDAAAFAVSLDGYDAKYEGLSLVAGRNAYAYALTAKSAANFTITAIFVDVRRHLPLREMFSVAGSGCGGHGWIDFVPARTYWMPSAVTAMCSPASSAVTYRESIHFSNYRFPAAIPAEIFRAPALPAASPL